MKRFITASLVFVVLASFCATACTLKCDEDMSCRGFGYEYINCHIDALNCACSDMGTGYDRYDLAVEGEDYSKPIISFNFLGNMLEYTVKFTAFSQMNVNYELCFVQNGVVLKSVRHQHYCMEGEEYVDTNTVSISNYNPENGEVYYILNSFEANIHIK